MNRTPWPAAGVGARYCAGTRGLGSGEAGVAGASWTGGGADGLAVRATGARAAGGRRGGTGACADGLGGVAEVDAGGGDAEVEAGGAGGVPGSAFMMLTGGIEDEEGKSYLEATGAPTVGGPAATAGPPFGCSAIGRPVGVAQPGA